MHRIARTTDPTHCIYALWTTGLPIQRLHIPGISPEGGLLNKEKSLA